jgi:hypothetical protein
MMSMMSMRKLGRKEPCKVWKVGKTSYRNSQEKTLAAFDLARKIARQPNEFSGKSTALEREKANG